MEPCGSRRREPRSGAGRCAHPERVFDGQHGSVHQELLAGFEGVLELVEGGGRAGSVREQRRLLAVRAGAALVGHAQAGPLAVRVGGGDAGQQAGHGGGGRDSRRVRGGHDAPAAASTPRAARRRGSGERRRGGVAHSTRREKLKFVQMRTTFFTGVSCGRTEQKIATRQLQRGTVRLQERGAAKKTAAQLHLVVFEERWPATRDLQGSSDDLERKQTRANSSHRRSSLCLLVHLLQHRQQLGVAHLRTQAGSVRSRARASQRAQTTRLLAQLPALRHREQHVFDAPRFVWLDQRNARQALSRLRLED